MKTELRGQVLLNDFEPTPDDFRAELLAGLRRRPKLLPCKFFYDELGSRLFDRICGLPEYYPTRTEMRILRGHLAEIADACGPRCNLVELGSGSSSKTRLLLDHLEDPVAYVPIDISRPHLVRAAETLNGDYPRLEILPVCADYNQTLALPPPARLPDRTVVFFPGSTIGNFEPGAAAEFLQRIGGWCRPGDGLIVGVDLPKHRAILEAAYNDDQGVTAAFNLNLLRRANRELGANFVLRNFYHQALYNQARSRIEMHLVSDCRQTVSIGTEQIPFQAGERVTTEFSYKYGGRAFRELAAKAGWSVEQTWTDADGWFSVHELRLLG